jgi:gamma-glutamyltranspeptidase/glutathione hydrolase/leukotriene-C4 hydrolase
MGKLRSAVNKRCKKQWVILVILLVYSIYSLAAPFDLRHGYNGAVASEHIECSQIGLDILKEGGSAVDAAIGTTLCIGTINMHSSGIGGGGFMVIKTRNEAVSLDFREKAPKAAYTDMFKNKPKASEIGGLSVGVPGELKGLEDAHKKYI